MNKAIIIMAKVPASGAVKTRLKSVLSQEDRAGFAAALLADTINKAAAAQNKLVVAYTPVERSDYFDRFSDHKPILFAQTGADLGEKMSNVFKFAFSLGLDAVLMIGTDSPTFPADFLKKAFDYLEEDSDAVLGKTADGGFYLIGLRAFERKIFENVKWSSAEAFDQTARNIEHCGLRLSLLPEWYDVDRPEDLARLRRELDEFPEAAGKTAEWLGKHIQD